MTDWFEVGKGEWVYWNKPGSDLDTGGYHMGTKIGSKSTNGEREEGRYRQWWCWWFGETSFGH